MIGIPKNEIIWARIKTESQRLFYITSKSARETYFLYEIIDNKANKIGKGSNPDELDKYIK